MISSTFRGESRSADKSFTAAQSSGNLQSSGSGGFPQIYGRSAQNSQHQEERRARKVTTTEHEASAGSADALRTPSVLQNPPPTIIPPN